MGSKYLNGQTGLYGLPATLPAGLDEQASSIVNNYLQRTEGLIYKTDRDGNPAYMEAASPAMAWTLQGAISPGTAVDVTVAPRPPASLVGEVLVLDRASTADPNPMEAVVVSAVSGATVTLKQVKYAHDANIKAESGMVITEERSLPSKRQIARYSKGPLAAILSMMGRYGYGRRSDQIAGMNAEASLITLASAFGQPEWSVVNPDAVVWSDASKEIWVPAGILLAAYTEVRIKYVAGYAVVPDDIVRATASIAASLIASTGGGGAGVKVIQAGDTRIERFAATNIDEETRKVLSPYRSQSFW